VLDANSTSIQRVRNGDSGYDPIIDADQLEKILGLSQHDSEDRDREARHGAVSGLVVTCMGEGEIMPFESLATPGNRNLKLTGPLGDVCVFSSPVPRRRVDVLIWVRLCRF
jgi:ATP-dependent Lon protease